MFSIKVDLPAPFGPSKAQVAPAGILVVTSRITSVPTSKPNASCEISTAGGDATAGDVVSLGMRWMGGLRGDTGRAEGG